MSERERLSARDLECRPNCFGSSVPIPVTIYMCYVPAEMGSVQSSQQKKNIYSMQNNLECDTTAAAAANSSSDYTF